MYPEIKKQIGLTDFETNVKNRALQKLHGQKTLKEYIALHSINKHFLLNKQWHFQK